MDYNKLSERDIIEIKHGTDSLVNIHSDEPDRSNIKIVCEGDSWFDYPPNCDIINFLKYYYHYWGIVNFAIYGDTLVNMVTKEGNLENILETVKKTGSNIFLFSAGGNDLVGDINGKFSPLNSLLNTYKPGMVAEDLVKKTAFKDFLNNIFRFEIKLIDSLIKVNKDIKILHHGYGYPVPDGTPVGYWFGVKPFIGPWIKPIFDKKGVKDLDFSKAVMKIIIDMFNEGLQQLQEKYKNNFYYIDCRDIVKDNSWSNELHLDNNNYLKVATEFHKKIQEII